MPRIAIFTEGQCEQVFVRTILMHIVDPSSLGFECYCLVSNCWRTSLYKYGDRDRPVFVLLYNVGNDESVITAIVDRHYGLQNRGYRILGLRDLYSERYMTRSQGRMDAGLVEDVQREMQVELANRVPPRDASLSFAVMELEAWFLGMHPVLAEIHPGLTPEFVENETGIAIEMVDPQTEFLHPAAFLKRLLRLVGSDYVKSRDDAERIASRVTPARVRELLITGRCQSLSRFLTTLLTAIDKLECLDSLGVAR